MRSFLLKQIVAIKFQLIFNITFHQQLAIANLLNITRQQYSLYETGKRAIPVNYLKVLANFYNTSSDYILEITDDNRPSKKSS